MFLRYIDALKICPGCKCELFPGISSSKAAMKRQGEWRNKKCMVLSEPSTSAETKDRQKRRTKMVDKLWRQASGAGIRPQEWDVFPEQSLELHSPHGPGGEPGGTCRTSAPDIRATWKQLVFPAHCLAAGVLLCLRVHSERPCL
ncbi:uncharacterized protein LOC142776447 [Rhipicephalus microplus]|uniref:uncharacterized protein LOC142776447 n=1 Tax=Rhipicephalus microplus TaxID=6941 RepID=UPI003F6C9A0D